MKSPGMMKVSTTGLPRIEGLPDPDLLRHDDAPASVGSALDTFHEALDETREARRVHREAEEKARENTLHVPGERDRWLAESAEKVKDERRAAEVAERRAASAARKVVEEITEHADTLRSIEARLALQAYARRVDAMVEAHEAGRDFRRFGGAPSRRPARGADPTVIGGGGVHENPLETLDRMDTHRLAEIAGTRCGLVEVVRFKGVNSTATERALTTPTRAAMLVEETGGERWRYAEGNDEEGSR
jgi:hypothetical protein